MKKILFLTIAAVFIIAAVAGGTWAYFSDTEVIEDNTFTAGTIDISLDPTSGQAVTTVEGDLDLKPCQTGYIPVCITNDGTNPCEVWKHIANVMNDENGVTEPEEAYYLANPGSDALLLSDYIHYDLLALRSLGYSWSGELETPDQEFITVEVEDGGSTVTWTIDFPIDDDTCNGLMAVGLVIALDGEGQGPAYQIHNNDGTCSAWDWGTWLYSPWDPTLGGWNGWHSSDPAWNTPVADMDWISATGDRYREDNPNGIFTITIDKCELVPDFHWMLYLAIGSGFCNHTYSQYYVPTGGSWSDPIVDMNVPNYEHADLAEQVLEITEGDGFYLTGGVYTDFGVECNWIYLGVLEPGQSMIVIQSYHLDASVENWGQSDQVSFDMEFFAQQTVGSPPPPGTELLGFGRP